MQTRKGQEKPWMPTLKSLINFTSVKAGPQTVFGATTGSSQTIIQEASRFSLHNYSISVVQRMIRSVLQDIYNRLWNLHQSIGDILISTVLQFRLVEA